MRRSDLLARPDPRRRPHPTATSSAGTGGDTLSDVLRSVRLRGAVFFFVTGGRRWAAEAPASREIAPAVMPGAEHVMEYHLVTGGECWAAIVGEPPVRLTAGDVILFPHGDAHVLSSAPGMRADPDVSGYYAPRIERLPLRVAFEGAKIPVLAAPGQSGVTTVACGFLSCDLRPFNPLIAALPRVLHLRADDPAGSFPALIHRAVAESDARRPGAEAMLARLSEMLFVDAVRRHLESLPPEARGWLAGLRDEIVGRALTLLHEEPARDWTVEALGRRVGLSRSPLHERFLHFVGQPPMQYLAHWRMQLASGLLRSSNATVGAVALEVGYRSEAAFARAFKRLVGQPPAQWRRSSGGASPGERRVPATARRGRRAGPPSPDPSGRSGSVRRRS